VPGLRPSIESTHPAPPTGAARKIEYQRVDGAQADQRELRNALFACSGKKAVYPQLFAVKDGAHSYVGDYAALHSANEQDTLDALLSPLTTAS
jgi:hypothetical protein